MEYDDIRTTLNQLPKRRLSDMDKAEIWQHVETEFTQGKHGFARRVHRRGWTAAVSAAAILLVAAGGIGGYRAIQHRGLMATTGSGLLNSNMTAYVKQSADWRVLAVPVLFGGRKEYHIEMMYIGKQAVSDIYIKPSDAAGVQASAAVYHTGDVICGWQELMSNFDQSSIAISWSGPSGIGHSYTFDFHQGVRPATVENRQVRTGHDANWQVWYASETVQGNGFAVPYGAFHVQYVGLWWKKGMKIDVSVPKNRHWDASVGGWKISELSGSNHNWKQSDYDVSVFPGSMGWTQSQPAELKIKWQGGTDVVQLHAATPTP